jgi:hypothetical protein
MHPTSLFSLTLGALALAGSVAGAPRPPAPVPSVPKPGR